MGWGVIGPCIWDLTAVEAEFEVRSCESWDAAYAWIKAQGAKAASLQLLVDNTTGETDAEEEVLARFKSTMVCNLRYAKWGDSEAYAARLELPSRPGYERAKPYGAAMFTAIILAKASKPGNNKGSSTAYNLGIDLSNPNGFAQQILAACQKYKTAPPVG